MVKLDLPQDVADAVNGTPAESSPDSKSVDTSIGTASAVVSGSRSSSWSRPERWLAEEGQRIEVGTIIKDRFELLELVGEGGMGMVFRALDRRKVEAQDRNPYLAIKILNEQFKRHPESLKALQREARKAQDLAHPNIVTVFDFDREGSTVFMTMEYLDGESLKEIIKKNPQGIAPERALSYIEGMCHGLSYAHAKGIVHSDFKPGNVFVTRAGLIKIFDFGIARAAKTKQTGGVGADDKTTFDAATLGALTPAYASPEMFLGQDPDPRDDIFALACIAYELFCGKHPFDKERSDLARKNGLHPQRLEQLNRLQWKGLLKGLDFERDARMASAAHFLREITREKSKLPLIVGGSTLAMLLLVSVFNKQIKNGWNQYTVYSIKDKINAILESESDENLTGALVNFRNSVQESRDIFLKNDYKPIVISTYARRARKIIDSDARKYSYHKSIQLLTGAKEFYKEDVETVKELSRLIDEYKTEQSVLISGLRDSFDKLISEGKILPSRDQENVFNVMESVALIDPGNPLLTDPRLIDAYVREGGNSLEQGDLDRARAFIRTGLEVSDSSPQLKELNDKLSIRLHERDVRSEVVRLETAISDRLNALQSVRGLGAMGEELRKLRELQPEHELLAKAEKVGLGLLDGELKTALDSHDWHAGDDLLKEVAALNLLRKETLQSRQDQLTATREKLEGTVEALFDKANMAIADGQPEGAFSLISEIRKLVPGDVRLQRLIAKAGQACLQLAREAKGRHQWNAARETLDLALKQDFDEAMKKYLLKEREEITLAEERYGPRMQGEGKPPAEAEALKDKKRRDEIVSLYEQFESELKTFQPTANSVHKALAILDTIEIKKSGDPFVGDGRRKIEQLFLREGESLRTSGSFEQAIRSLQVGAKALPDSQLLAHAIQETRQQRELAKKQEQEAKLATIYGEADALIASASMTREWEARLQKVIIDISFLHSAGQDAKLPEIKKKIAALYLQQAQKFRAEQQFARANEALDKCDRYEKGGEAMVKERRLVAADEKAFKHNAQSQRKLAEIEGIKQSLRTDARANEVDDARNTLSQLKDVLPAEDDFLVREAPQLIAVAYLRLAEKKAGARDNREDLMAAVELAKSGLALDPASTGLQIAVENYNRTIAKLEKTTTPALAPLAMSGPAASSSTAPGKPCFAELAGLGVNARAVCYDMVSAQDKGPDMVVIPAGGGNSNPYAIGKYEISHREYDVFCKATGKASLKTSEESDIPVTGVSYQDARAYAKWLTEKTGITYRIPKDGEWVHAAEAGGSRPVTDYNCFLQQGSTVLKGNGPLGVRTGGPNAWGLQNFIGNVQEYVDSSSGIKVRGGSYKDSMSACGVSLVKNHPGVPDQLTGFRLVREIKE